MQPSIGQNIRNLQLLHNCLLFQLNAKRYIYCLTSSFLQSKYLLKYNPHFVILPSDPYIRMMFSHAGVHRWFQTHDNTQSKWGIVGNLDMLRRIYGTASVDNLVAKGHLTNLLQVKQLSEEYLIQQLFALQEKRGMEMGSDSTPQLQSYINNPSHSLCVLVPQQGTSAYVIHKNKMVAVEPSQQSIVFMCRKGIMKEKKKSLSCGSGGSETTGQQSSKGMLIELLDCVFIHRVESVYSVLSLLLVEGLRRINMVVLDKALQRSIFEIGWAYLNFPEDMIREKLLIRTVQPDYQYPLFPQRCNIECQHFYNKITFMVTPLSYSVIGSVRKLMFYIGGEGVKGKQVIFYFGGTLPQGGQDLGTGSGFMDGALESEINEFPQQMMKKEVEHVVMYKIGEQLMGKLKSLPSQFRKKIILNRISHKYNHKYFATLTHATPHMTITNTQYLKLLSNHSVQHNQAYFNYQQETNKWKVVELSDGQQMDTRGLAVGVLEGFILIESNSKQDKTKEFSQEVIGEGNRVLIGTCKIVSLKQAKVKIILQTHYSQLHPLRPQEHLQHTEQLETFMKNSILRRLPQSSKAMFLSLCRPAIYQGGTKVNKSNGKVYLIVKGSMKWRDNGVIVSSGGFLADLSSYYEGNKREKGIKSEKEKSGIEVMKDTWVLQMRIEEFHEFVMLKNTKVLHQMLMSDKAFV